jgi:imidazolonepropionase-like amidohydrolase
VVGHFARNLPLDVNLRGRTSVDHIEEFNYTYFFKETPAGAWAAREALLPEVAKRVASAKVGVTTTIWYIRQASLIGRVETGRSVRTADEIRYLPASEVRRLNGKSVDAVSEREQRSTNSNLAFQLRMARSFVDAGVSLMTGTDASLRSLVVPGFSLHRELGELTAAGLTPYEAIRAATVAPSQVLGRRSGTVTVGHAADLILLDGNPLLDIASLRRNAGVMARGRWFPTSALQDSLLAVRGRARDR